jgi:hypothetical protein
LALESENVEQLMEWLADGGVVRSADAAADTLVEKLGTVVFQGDADWPSHVDRIARYRDGLSKWFAEGGGGLESQFVALTSPNADPGALVGWLLPVVVGWEGRGAGNAAGAASAGGAVVGLPNPNSDGTPDTAFYRVDETTGAYLYAGSADSQDWASYEKRRYTEPSRQESYGLDCRYDRTNGVYEWYDEAAGTWNDQAWADQRAAQGPASVSGSGATAGLAEAATAATTGPTPEWDDSWAMFYRAGPGGAYEFADAVTPGERASGCGGVWLSQDQVAQRRAQAAPAAPAAEAAASAGSQRQVILEHIPDIAKLVPGFDTLTEDQIAEVVKNYLESVGKA